MNAINLEVFCDPNDPSRPWLGQPFSAGAWTYATDGHIMVRVPRLDDIAESPDAAPKAESHRERCPSCNCKCHRCDGTGKLTFAGFHRTTIGKALYNSKYVSLLQTLPQLELGQPHRSNPLPFRFDGGEGLLMPCRPHL
jgi:hypothetical protein